ncbi:MAG: diacylglycerol kinase family protein [Pelobium sp.]
MPKPNKKVLFVINHKAGKNGAINLNSAISNHAQKYSYDFDIHFMEDNPSFGIEQKIKKHQPDIIAALGGDGTVSLIASLIQFSPISLLIVPFGSANGMAKELQIPDNIIACLDLIINGQEVKIDLLKVNDSICVHLSDVGLNARIVKRFQLDNKRGLLIYGKHLFFEAFFLKRKQFQIFYNDQIKKVKAVSLTFANATKYGTGAVINPDGILNDGYFEICIVRPFPNYHIFKIAYQMFRGTLKYSNYFDVLKCTEATIKCSKRTLLQVDGEVLNRVNEIRLVCLPKALSVIISKNLSHPTLIN